jgi:hypothetical protein
MTHQGPTAGDGVGLETAGDVLLAGASSAQDSTTRFFFVKLAR